MKSHNELKIFFEASPLAFMRVIPFNEVCFDDRCKFLCKYGCKNFQRKYCCPPDSLELKEAIQNHNYKWTLLAATSSPLPPDISPYKKLFLNRHKEHEIQRISTNLQDLFIKNKIGHIVLSGGACKKCHICSKIVHLKCKKPNQKLTSMEAVGIDCQKTLSSAGFPFEMPAKIVSTVVLHYCSTPTNFLRLIGKRLHHTRPFKRYRRIIFKLQLIHF